MKIHRLAGAVLIGSFLGLAYSAFAASPRRLTFEDRVKAQEAIERVYYAHRIWPKENPQPKPPFEQMVPKALIEAKVKDYLKKCNALDKFWQRPIQSEQLQAEMDRMAKGTKDPATLKELFAALNNDPYLIAECLARPILADRLIHNWYAYDTRFHGDVREKADRALKEAGDLMSWPDGAFGRTEYRLADGAGVEPPERRRSADDPIVVTLDAAEFSKAKEKFSATDRFGFIEEPEAFQVYRVGETTTTRLTIESLAFAKRAFVDWWSESSCALEASLLPASQPSTAFSIAGSAVPEAACSDMWLNGTLAHEDAPSPRSGHTAVWTGSEMIVWGGGGASSVYFNSGGRYNPATDTWTLTSTGADCPAARSGHTAVWTGTEMIVWGGYSPSLGYTSSGGRYNPSTDTWQATGGGTGCPAPRRWHTAVWTGSLMIVWGGSVSGGNVNTGGRYNPSTNTWAATSTAGNCPTIRTGYTAVWTGSEMIIWGGAGVGYLNTGARYNPSSDTWVPTNTSMPSGRAQHTAVWTGTEMIIWGGNNGACLNSGYRYNPSNDSWTTVSTGGACPSARAGYTAIWTGTEMII